MSTGVLYVHACGHLGMRVPNWLKYLMLIDVLGRLRVCNEGEKDARDNKRDNTIVPFHNAQEPHVGVQILHGAHYSQ